MTDSHDQDLPPLGDGLTGNAAGDAIVEAHKRRRRDDQEAAS